MMEQDLAPPPLGRAKAAAYAIGLPVALALLIFVPAGTWRWRPGWVFLAVTIGAFLVSALILSRVNPVIFRARSRFQPGTKGWDLALLSVMLPLVVAIVPIAAYAVTHGEPPLPPAVMLAGYGLMLAGIAVTAWAQAVNAFFEPGVRIQTERHQRVVSEGPYRLVRHPGYVAALALFFGMALALGSRWALLPAAGAAILLVVRTTWEDDLLRRDLPGYADYAARVRYRLLPGLW